MSQSSSNTSNQENVFQTPTSQRTIQENRRLPVMRTMEFIDLTDSDDEVLPPTRPRQFLNIIDDDFDSGHLTPLQIPNKNRFRLQAKNIALTYSNIEQQRTSFSHQELLEFLRTLPDVHYVLVSKEHHEDGNTHYHALVTLSKKPDIRNSRFFDYQGCHPNIQACKKVQAWKTYVKKDGDWLSIHQTNRSSTHASH